MSYIKNHGIIRGTSNKKKYHWSYQVKTFGLNYRLSDCGLGYVSALGIMCVYFGKQDKNPMTIVAVVI